MSAKILYIEDEPHHMRLVDRMLKSSRYALVEATDGASGIKVAQLWKPDLILLDINLPDMDGFEVGKRLKSSPETGHIPVIALTANAMHGDKERLLNAGFNAYVAKPVTRNELLNAIALCLEYAAQG